MADTPSIHSPARAEPQPEAGFDSAQYWCYHCDKRVAVESLPGLPDVVCFDCKNGFVESISNADIPSLEAQVDPLPDPSLGNQFIQVLRLIAQRVREEEDAPPPLPSDQSDEDYLRIELDLWENENEDDDDEHSVEVVQEEDSIVDNRSDVDEEDDMEVVEPIAGRDDDDDDDVDEDGEEDRDGDGEEMRQTRRDILRLSLRDIPNRAATRRNRILDWADILMGLEDHTIQLRLQVPDSDSYIGNPEDYVNAMEYEALLQTLAESDSGAKRGPPPAAKAAVEGLKGVVVKEEDVMMCAICKDTVGVGEIAKNLPCGHGYHGECIVPWLGSRNTCPVCRFELPTDDPDYEEERKKSFAMAGLRAAASASSSDSGGGGHDAF